MSNTIYWEIILQGCVTFPPVLWHLLIWSIFSSILVWKMTIRDRISLCGRGKVCLPYKIINRCFLVWQKLSSFTRNHFKGMRFPKLVFPHLRHKLTARTHPPGLSFTSPNGTWVSRGTDANMKLMVSALLQIIKSFFSIPRVLYPPSTPMKLEG